MKTVKVTEYLLEFRSGSLDVKQSPLRVDVRKFSRQGGNGEEGERGTVSPVASLVGRNAGA